jgi:guanine deaminase
MSDIPAGTRAFLGDFLHAPQIGSLEMLHDTLVVVGPGGAIEAVHPAATTAAPELIARHRAAGSLEIRAEGRIWIPGLIDLHVHAPQWPQLGLALDLPLEDWLQTHTFPLEARCSDIAFAGDVYASLVDALLANGTTTVLYYASIHLPATQLLADICLRRGQRALIGRVAMDDPVQCPPYYRDASAADAIADTRRFIDHVRALRGDPLGLIHPVITPRFIPSCSDALLHGLGDLARESGCHVQTHCSESDWEHAHVLARCGVSDTVALERYGLLSRRTILAHGNFLGGDDVGRIVHHGAGIAHCPLSNVYFSDAVFPLRRWLDRGVHVGLGTDIAGGASPSILDNARQAIIASRLLESGVDPDLPRARRRLEGRRIDAPTAFWLATTGGGIALDLPLGLFRERHQFDAVVIDARAPGGNLRLAAADGPSQILQKLIYHGARANVAETWVAGRRVHAAATVPERRGDGGGPSSSPRI